MKDKHMLTFLFMLLVTLNAIIRRYLNFNVIPEPLCIFLVSSLLFLVNPLANCSHLDIPICILPLCQTAQNNFFILQSIRWHSFPLSTVVPISGQLSLESLHQSHVPSAVESSRWRWQ